MRTATLASVIVVVFLVGSAFGFYVLPALTPDQSSQQMYALAFSQQGFCGAYGAPWSVAINGHSTVVEPSNATLPLSNTQMAGLPSYKNFSVIWFHVTNGVYTYVVAPTDFFHNGTVTVNSANTIVTVTGPLFSASSTCATP
ncbi:MAG TPA: hypothetical protein VEJ19_07405 [Nitrososphaerales archaeon]|nr:hypothetical protein [Nitrososphaerales archaeon]